MFFWGVILGLLIAYFSLVLQDLGLVVLFAIVFGMLFSIMQKFRKLHADIQLIKEAVIGKEPEEAILSNKEIEQELEEENNKT